MTKVGTQADFNNFAKNHIGIPSVVVDMATPNNAVATPYITEKAESRMQQMDIFSRLMRDRIIYVAGAIDDPTAWVLSAQMMYLDMADSNRDINLYVDGPGGGVKAGLTIIDTMNYVICDIATINLGMAASMDSVILAGGTKGKRGSLKHSRVMLHQVSGGAQGNIQDVDITYEEMKKYNKELLTLLSGYTGQDLKKIKADTNRDKWFNTEEAIKYGLIDYEITKRVI